MRCDMKCKMWVVKCKTGARTSIASDMKGQCDRKCYVGIQGYCFLKKKVENLPYFKWWENTNYKENSLDRTRVKW